MEPEVVLLQDSVPAKVFQHPKSTGVTGRQRQSWTNGAEIPLDMPIVTLKDAILTRLLAHHEIVLDLPADWWIDP